MERFAVGIALGLGLFAASAAAQSEGSEKIASTPVATLALRASVVPRPEDVAVLQAGQALMLGSSRGGLTIVEYAVEEGRIVWRVTTGAIDDATRRQIERAVARMQQRLSR